MGAPNLRAVDLIAGDKNVRGCIQIHTRHFRETLKAWSFLVTPTCCIIIDKVSPFSSSTATKVLDLHDFLSTNRFDSSFPINPISFQAHVFWSGHIDRSSMETESSDVLVPRGLKACVLLTSRNFGEAKNYEGCVRCLQQVDIEYKTLKARLLEKHLSE
ncbi:hypothetical protein YC2023_118278 [Brassica napus]